MTALETQLFSTLENVQYLLTKRRVMKLEYMLVLSEIRIVLRMAEKQKRREFVAVTVPQ